MAQRGDSGESKTKIVLQVGKIEMHREAIEQIMNTEGGQSKKKRLRTEKRDQLQVAEQDITSEVHTSPVQANTEIVVVVGNVINEMKASEAGEPYRLMEIEGQDLGQKNILISDSLRLIETSVYHGNDRLLLSNLTNKDTTQGQAVKGKGGRKWKRTSPTKDEMKGERDSLKI